MSAIDEKIVEQIWNSVEPILTVPRVITFIAFCLLLSPQSHEIFSSNVFLMKLEDFLELIQKSFKTIELWKLLFVLIVTTVIAPYITFKINKYLIKNVHIHNATKLIEQLKLNSVLKLTELLNNRLKGINRIKFHKDLGEVISVITIGVIYSITIPQSIGLTWILIVLLFLGSWVLAMYLNSQRLLIIFLTDIAPFNIAQLKNSKIEKN